MHHLAHRTPADRRCQLDLHACTLLAAMCAIWVAVHADEVRAEVQPNDLYQSTPGDLINGESVAEALWFQDPPTSAAHPIGWFGVPMPPPQEPFDTTPITPVETVGAAVYEP